MSITGKIRKYNRKDQLIAACLHNSAEISDYYILMHFRLRLYFYALCTKDHFHIPSTISLHKCQL